MNAGTRIEVAYAAPERQLIDVVEVPPGTNARDAVRRSRIPREFPDIDIDTCPLGIFGAAVTDDYVPAAGDRIELYRPLRLNPREARRERARRTTAGQ